jgi:adenine-specific DNA-methyltransferase
MAQDIGTSASIYKHNQQAVQRPDAGVEAQFSNKKGPKTYRYDSSLAPELSWDESADRAFAEWLLALVADAAEKGESAVFVSPQVWQGNGEIFSSLSQCVARLRSLTKPFLNWTGKAERQQVTVPTLPLFVHERHSTQAILETLKSHKALGTNLDLFGDTNLDIADKLDAYDHKGPWTNRLILGDSLQVMNSMLEYEGMGGQVQMIYFDPPYGVKFGSNFQPFVRKRDVKHGPDDQMIREPEMVKAYRDTWELGLHSYLTYLRDRLTVAHDLMTPSASIFVQISDDNLHHVREVMDEVFGEKNFCSVIAFNKTSGFSPKLLSNVADYLLWYAKDINSVRYRQIFLQKELGEEGATQYNYVESLDGSVFRTMTAEEQADPSTIGDNFRILTHGDMSAQGTSGNTEPFDFNGKTFRVPANCHWKTTPDGMRRLAEGNRLLAMGNSLRYKRYLSDFPLFPISNVWTDTGTSGFAAKKLYTVQTNPAVVQRCMLMTTDPGDLVLDITCGSGTTAVVAEQWGRRWITVDTSLSCCRFDGQPVKLNPAFVRTQPG